MYIAIQNVSLVWFWNPLSCLHGILTETWVHYYCLQGVNVKWFHPHASRKEDFKIIPSFHFEWLVYTLVQISFVYKISLTVSLYFPWDVSIKKDPSSEPDQFQVVFLTRLIKNIVFHRHMVTCSQSGMTLLQGWDFTLYFFERIARFLWAKERNSDSLFSKSNGSNSLKDIKKGKSVKNCQKHNENYEYFPANR